MIRVSGPSALALAAKLFRSAKKIATDYPTHTAHHGAFVRPSSLRHSEPIDDVVLTIFRAPHSYTGEDIAEFSCHGSMAVLKAALSAVLESGARLAEPGEFTKRAFLNGKIDLAQAEAVNDLIRARTDGSRRVALRQLDGDLSQSIKQISDRILGVIAAIEAAIDFPEDVHEPKPDWVKTEIEKAQESVDNLLASFGKGRVFREGLRVVIAGKVNVGKSSLLNALLRHARAIVTPIPGTTRDTIEESLEIEGIPIVAIDTAGLRATDDEVERIGVELAHKSMETADLVLMVLDASTLGEEIDIGIPKLTENTPIIVVLNKIDLVPDGSREKLIDECLRELGQGGRVVSASAAFNIGIEQLEREIASMAAANAGESVIVSNIRHRQSLQAASDSLNHALATTASSQMIDLLSVDLTAARNALGLITGETATEDLLDRIFSEFCIGK